MTKVMNSALIWKPAHLSLAAIIVLGIYNVILLVLPGWTHVAVSVLVALGLVLLAHRSGLSWFDIGLGRHRLQGLRRGITAGGIVVVAMALLVAIPASRQLLADARFVGVSASAAVRKVLIEIPLTVGFEEVVFRGVLLGALLRATSVLRAVLTSTAIFGLWHVLPTVELLETERNLPLDSSPLALFGTLAAIFVVGLGFAWLRLADRGILSPFVAHATLNGVSYLVGWSIVTWEL